MFPETRVNADELLVALGLNSYNRWTIVRKIHGVMADDEIWLRFKGETLKHRDVTLRKSLYSREEDWEYVIAKTVERFGRLDGLLNNAGILIRNGIFETSLEEFEKIQSINRNGTFLGMKQAAGLMKKSGSGSIINISSIWGLVGSPTSIAYHSSKGAIRLMSKAAAIELAKDFNRVNSIHPGVIATAMSEVSNGQHPLKEKTPWPNLGTPEDIVYGAMYLLSDESRFVTGTELVIDGGYTAQ